MTRITRTAAISVAVIALTACSGGSLESTEAGIVGFHDFSEGPQKSFGITVCASDGDVELESVEALETEGEIELLGALHFQPETTPIGASNDFPPRGVPPELLEDLEGAVVTAPCGSDAAVSQVVVGAERTGPSGGMLSGIRINHQGGSIELEDFAIVLCGDQLERCEQFAPESG